MKESINKLIKDAQFKHEEDIDRRKRNLNYQKKMLQRDQGKIKNKEKSLKQQINDAKKEKNEYKKKLEVLKGQLATATRMIGELQEKLQKIEQVVITRCGTNVWEKIRYYVRRL